MSRTEPAALKLAKQIRNHQYGVRGFGDGSLQRGRNFTDAEQRVLVAALEQYTGVSRTDLCTLCNALIVPRNPTHYDPEDMKAAKVRAALLVSRTEPALTDELCAGLLACAEMLRPHLEAEARSDDYAVSKSANRRLDGLRHYEQIARRGPK